MSDRFLSRRERLRRTVSGDRSRAILVASSINVGYLTGFTGESAALIVSKDRTVMVSDFRYEEQIAQECPGLETLIRPVGQTLVSAIAGVASKLGISCLGFEANRLLVSEHDELRDALGSVATLGEVGRVEALRAIKDEHEIAATRLAVTAAQSAFAKFCFSLDPSWDEVEAADHLEAYLKACGSTRPAFDPIVASGARSALPHARPIRGAVLGASDFVLVDWGATVDGYRSDLTRMIVTGTVGEDFRAMYGAVLAVQERAIAAIRPGARAIDIDTEARKTFAETGFAKMFGHGLGHGLGLEIHESPWFRPRSDDILQEGMIVTVEPGLYRPGWGGIRIEDDVLVTPDGHEVLTDLPKSLESLSPL